MPRATRNTNANSGNPGSACAKPELFSKIPTRVKTSVKISVEIPRAAPNESTTVPIRISGASSDRSSRIRISSTTTRTIGMITLLSRIDAVLVSR